MGDYSDKLPGRISGKPTDITGPGRQSDFTHVAVLPDGIGFDVCRGDAIERHVKIHTHCEDTKAAIGHLISELQSACDDGLLGGRAHQLRAAQKSLLAVLQSLQAMGVPIETGQPILTLVLEMNDLLLGRASGLLQPIGKLANSSQELSVAWMGRAYLIAAAERLSNLKRQSAFEKVAEDIVSAGYTLKELLPADRGRDQSGGNQEARLDESERARQIELAANRLRAYRYQFEGGDVPGGQSSILRGLYCLTKRYQTPYNYLLTNGIDMLRVWARATRE